MKKRLIYSTIASFLLIDLFFYKREESILYQERIENHVLSCDDDNYFVIAHRGFSSVGIENTESSLSMCDDVNCIDGIEIDLRLTKDENLILLHNKVLNGRRIETLTLDEIKSMYVTEPLYLKEYISSYLDIEMGYSKRARTFSLSKKKEQVLTFEDALRIIPDSKTLLIDMKFEKEEERNNIMIERTIECLQEEKKNLITIQSTSPIYLEKMREKAPYFSYQLIVKDEKTLKKYFSSFNAFAIKEDMITKEWIDTLRVNEKEVSIWTINDYKTLTKIIKEIDPYQDEISYITDYPDCLCYILQKKNKYLKNKYDNML